MNYTCLNEMANTETATKSIAKSDHGYKKMSQRNFCWLDLSTKGGFKGYKKTKITSSENKRIFTKNAAKESVDSIQT